MKEYCVSLELAKELKESGFSQNSCFSHICGNNIINCPVSDEILRELPRNFIYNNNDYWIYIIKDHCNNYQVYYKKQ